MLLNNGYGGILQNRANLSAAKKSARTGSQTRGTTFNGPQLQVSEDTFTSSPAPKRTATSYVAASPLDSVVSGGGDGGGGSAAPAAPATPSLKDYLSGDASYLAQLAALQKALQQYISGENLQQQQYDNNYNQSLDQLGYDPTTKSWNWNDLNTAAGRSRTNQTNDFASRGLLQSTAYNQALADLERSLTDQVSDLSTQRQNYDDQIAQAIASYKDQNVSQQQQARADALQRWIAQYGTTAPSSLPAIPNVLKSGS